MQIKPFFDEYEELWRKPVCKDDLGNQYSLVKFIGKQHGEPSIEGLRVMSDTLSKHSNGVTSYDENLYWRAKDKELSVLSIEDYRLEEVNAGTHSQFWPIEFHGTIGVSSNNGLKTTFKVTKL